MVCFVGAIPDHSCNKSCNLISFQPVSNVIYDPPTVLPAYARWEFTVIIICPLKATMAMNALKCKTLGMQSKSCGHAYYKAMQTTFLEGVALRDYMELLKADQDQSWSWTIPARITDMTSTLTVCMYNAGASVRGRPMAMANSTHIAIDRPPSKLVPPRHAIRSP